VDNKFRYRQKHVHDVGVLDGFVRVWDAAGNLNRRGIADAFEPLQRTGFVYPYIALMPDHHPGEGAMVGSVIPTRDVLLLSVIGGDLGCGMTAVRLPVESSTLKDRLPGIREDLRAIIPKGSAHNATVGPRVKSNPIWRRSMECGLLTNRLSRKLLRQFGSLGGGNHFLELQEDRDGFAWLMLHSGSRYLGVLIKDFYIKAGSGQEDIDQRVFRRIPYLPACSALAVSYMADLGFALDFARKSRREMMLRAIEVVAGRADAVREAGMDAVCRGIHDVTHNYVAQEEHFGENLFIHRKGAVRASTDDLVFIPSSMGTCSYIADGRGNEFSFASCSHGAGRVMSRHAAIATISDKAFEESMYGVVHENDPRLKDESPSAYKDIGTVMRGQKDLVRIRMELRPLMSFKGVN